jgi:hypothetical protein
MSQKLASLQDINKWLTDHKVEATDSNTSQFQLTATRLIKSALSGVFFPTTLFSWQSPDTTPGQIREIAGELVAAYLYRELYAEDEPGVPEYAQVLYNEATALLNQVRGGSLVVLDENDNPIEENGLQMQQTDFWPNDTTAGPYFSMSDTFS